jgi:hypothetical protein
MYTFCISIEATDKFLWQIFYALKSYEKFMSPTTPFNVVATVAYTEGQVKEYKEILDKMVEDFEFFFWLEHEVMADKGYPRSFHKIHGPSLLDKAPWWDKVYDNIIVLDADVWLTKPFSIDFQISEGSVRFWRAKGIAPNFDILASYPYFEEMIFAAGLKYEEVKEKWFEHSAYYMIHKSYFKEWFDDVKDVYHDIYPVFKHVEKYCEDNNAKYDNYAPWFCEMYAPTFASLRLDKEVLFFDSYFHCGNGVKDTYYFLCTFLHFFVAKDQVYWSKFWDWNFPFTDKQWNAITKSLECLPKHLTKNGLFVNTQYILQEMLKYKKDVDSYRPLRSLTYNDLDGAPLAHNSLDCEYCRKILEG